MIQTLTNNAEKKERNKMSLKYTYKIKNTNNQVVFSGLFYSHKECIEEAVRNKVSLENADLSGMDLSGACLQKGNFINASFLFTVLDNVDFSYSILNGCNLKNAVSAKNLKLTEVNLTNTVI